MGWKNVKTHYRIEHIVQVLEGRICIGSGFISDIIVIDEAGNLVKTYDGGNTDLSRYQAEMLANPAQLQALVTAPDSFDRAIPVYTYARRQGVVLEKLCEAPGYPNITHDGILMYENTFSVEKEKVARWAKEDARLGIRVHQDNIAELQEKIERQAEYLADEQAALAQLDADYPHL